MDDNLKSELLFHFINLTIFALSVFLTCCFQKLFKGRFVFMIFAFVFFLSIFVFGLKKTADNQESKYRLFDVKRCSTKREINSKFRVWSKTVHPDKNSIQQTSSFSYEELDSLKDFLTTDHYRIFYDKFDQVFDRETFDEKDIKNVKNFLFQKKLFQYLNTTFVWIFLSFLFSKYLQQLEITNFLMKILMGKTFVIVYFLYSQEIEQCSLLDDVFEFSTISQQIFFSEFFISFVFGFITTIYFRYLKEEKEKLIQSIDQTKAFLSKKVTDCPHLKDLKQNVEKFRKFYDN